MGTIHYDGGGVYIPMHVYDSIIIIVHVLRSMLRLCLKQALYTIHHVPYIVQMSLTCLVCGIQFQIFELENQ